MPNQQFAEIVAALKKAREIAIFSGAGLSADSGIPTFRDGATGLWNNVDPDEVASVDGFERNPRLVWQWLRQLKQLINDCRPNPGHLAIARLEALCPDKNVTVITQNIDGYHRSAGNERILEIHGTIHGVRCHRHCGFTAEWEESADEPFACPACGAPVRPDVVLFGEALDQQVFADAGQRSAHADLFFCVGTSFTVQPAAQLPMWAKSFGATVVEVNPYPTPFSQLADFSLRSGASEFFSALCAALAEQR